MQTHDLLIDKYQGLIGLTLIKHIEKVENGMGSKGFLPKSAVQLRIHF